MEIVNEKLEKLYNDCIEELKSIGINLEEYGEFCIGLSKRNNKRYGCCKQENPIKETKYIEKIGRRKYIKYGCYKKHNIEVSKWVMDLNDDIIKNTIMHEIVHCFPYCNNHGIEFKKYANIINSKLGYTITRVGNKIEDYKKSNIEYKEKNSYKYKIECEQCGQTFFRKRLQKNFSKKYRCGKCGGKLIIK